MARNKYPEVTVEKILDVSQRLFLEKSYDNTTIQDIVNELGGLTKGAIYHHFKSKEEIMDALTHKMFLNNNPFDAVKKRKDLNGLEKMKMAMLLNQSDHERIELSQQAVPILKNPRILAGIIESNREVLSPFWFELFKEGKFVFVKELLDKMGVPLIDDEILETVGQSIARMGKDNEIKHLEV